MSEILLPGAEIDRTAFTGSGPHPGSVYTLTWHSTESGPGSINGAVASLHANRAESNVVAEPRAAAKGGRRAIQLVDLNRASKSLRNTATPGQTNKAGTVQVEVIMRAGDPCADMTADDWRWLGKLGGDISRLTGIPIQVPMPFHQYPPEDGHRLGREPWRTLDDTDDGSVQGWVGHQHWQENSHGDPGAWSTPQAKYGHRSPLDLMLEGAGATQPKDWFDTMDEKTFDRKLSEAFAARGLDVIPDGKRDGKGNLLLRIRNEIAKQGPRTEETVKGIRRLLPKAKV